MKEKVKLPAGFLYLEKEGVKNSYYLNGKKIFETFPLELKDKISVIICTARKLNIEKIKQSIINIKKLNILLDIVVIVGNEKDRQSLKRLFKDEFIKVILNKDFQDTVYTSLKMGLRAINPRNSFIVLLFGNQEPLEASTYNEIVKRVLPSNRKIFIPTYEGERGHPLVFSSSLLGDLLSLRKEKGIPYLLRKFKSATEEIALTDKKVLLTVN
jgi:molybdenum cofactor cytidylyltransferase